MRRRSIDRADARRANAEGDVYASITLPQSHRRHGRWRHLSSHCRRNASACWAAPGRARRPSSPRSARWLRCAGELAIVGAMASGAFARAHAAGGRKALCPTNGSAQVSTNKRKPVRRLLYRTILPPFVTWLYRKLGNTWRYETEHEEPSPRAAEGTAPCRWRLSAWTNLPAASLLQPTRARSLDADVLAESRRRSHVARRDGPGFPRRARIVGQRWRESAGAR